MAAGTGANLVQGTWDVTKAKGHDMIDNFKMMFRCDIVLNLCGRMGAMHTHSISKSLDFLAAYDSDRAQ